MRLDKVQKLPAVQNAANFWKEELQSWSTFSNTKYSLIQTANIEKANHEKMMALRL